MYLFLTGWQFLYSKYAENSVIKRQKMPLT